MAKQQRSREGMKQEEDKQENLNSNIKMSKKWTETTPHFLFSKGCVSAVEETQTVLLCLGWI